MATRFTLSMLVLALFTQLLPAQKAVFSGRAINGITAPELEREFTAWQIFDLDAAVLNSMVKSSASGAEVRLQLGADYDWLLSLQPDDIRSASYRLNLATDNGVQMMPKNENKTFGGYAAGLWENQVRLTLDEDFIFGYVESGEVTYFIEPAWRFKADLPKSYYVVYRTDQVRPRPDLRCGWAESEHRKAEIKQQKTGEEKLLGNCYTVEIALASDFSMFQALGSATAVQNFMLGVLNNVQTNYDTEFADIVQFEVVTQFVVTTSGGNPWTNSTNSDLLLESFRDWGNAGNFGVPFDVASLWTNRDFVGDVIGLTWLGGLCTDLRYNILQRFSTNAAFLRVLQAHELGHNFNSNHDAEGSNTIMAPAVSTATAWSTMSINVINNFLSDVAAGGGCFSSCGGTSTEPPVAAITSPAVHICAGSVVPLIDNTSNSPNAWNWIMPGATPASSNQQHPTVRYTNPGNYVATLVVSNDAGTDVADLDIQVDEGGKKYLLYETFEAGPGPWGITNPDNSTTWEWTNVGGAQYGKKGMVLNNFSYTATNQKDGLTSPVLDLSLETDIILEIDYAYRRFNASRSDKLIVSVSTNGGSSFPTVVFQGQETGGGNFATAGDSQVAFLPTTANDWCFGTDFGAECLQIDLSAFAGEDNVRIRIENQTGHGNNMYIDNIRVSSSCLSLAPPTPDFTANVTIDCAPLTVQFEDLSTGIITGRSWSFPGGSPSFSEDMFPLVTYNTPGTYDVTLNVSNSAGIAVATETSYITVLGGPTANFSTTGNNLNVQTTNLSVNATSYVWNFGDGTPTSNATSPSHTYTQPGTYTIRLTAHNECGQSVKEISVTVTSPVSAAFSATPRQGCNPLTVTFSNQSTGNVTSWMWAFEGGTPATSTAQNPVVTFSQPGAWNVSLTVSNGTVQNTTSQVDYITVTGLPDAGFTALNPLGNDTVQFSNSSTAASSYHWDFGDDHESPDASPVHVYEADGTYTVTLIAGNDCGNDTISHPVTILLPPVATWQQNVSEGCQGLNVQFTAAPQDTAFTYAWTFEGGHPSVSDLPDPVIYYASAGSYAVQLIVTNAAGADTLTQDSVIVIAADPQAAFTAEAPSGQATAQFDNNSTAATSYHWDFGDGNESTDADPMHTYEGDGTYTVVLIAGSDCGSDTTFQQITILLPPTATWEQNGSEICQGLSVQFTAAPQGAGLTYAWTFEGGQPATSELPNPTVSYADAGTYAVQLIVANAAGSDTLAQSSAVTVALNPQAAFADNATPGQALVQFDNTSTVATSYHWDFDDGNESTDADPTHTYEADGTYTVTLIAGNACGSDTTSRQITILLPPTATWEQNGSEICQGLSVQFTAAPQGAGLTYAWTFEGGQPATSELPNPTVSYADAGTYAVQLIVANAAGSDTLAQSSAVTVALNPQAAFADNATPGQALVQFDNTSTAAGSYHWDFGDGHESTDANPAHTYAGDGTYTVTLIAGNACGSDTTSRQITILLLPVATWQQSIDGGCQGLNVQFTATTQGAGLTYAWTFEGGQPASSMLPDPAVSYAGSGSYTVQLIVTNAAGADTLVQNGAVTIAPDPQAAFAANATLGEASVQFDNNSTAANSYYWDFGDGHESTDANPAHTYEADGNYTVLLIATNSCGSDTAVQQVTILLPPVAGWQQNLSEGCEGLNIQFDAMPQGTGLTYAWTFEGGQPATSDLPDPTVSYTQAGVYPVQLIVTNAAGSDTLIQQGAVVINAGPSADFNAAVNGFEVTFENNTTGGSSYLWDFGDFTQSEEEAPGHVYEDEGIYTVILIVSNACGSDTASTIVTIDSAFPIAEFSLENGEGCVPLTVQFFNESVNADSVRWTFPGGIPNTSNAQNPVVVYASAGMYNVSLVAYNGAGSAAITEMNAVVTGAGPTAAFDATQDQATVSFLNISVDATSYHWIFGDGETSDAANPVHTYEASGDYLVQLIATNACGSDTLSKEVNILIVGVEEAGRKTGVNLYPNPNSGHFTLKVEAAPAPTATLALYDALGQVVYHEIEDFQRGQIDKTLVLDRLSAGVYWLTFKTGDFTITRKIIISY